MYYLLLARPSVVPGHAKGYDDDPEISLEGLDFQITLAALNVLSPRDEMGVLTYSWQQGGESWLYPLQVVGNKTRMRNLIQTMPMPSSGSTR